MTMRSTPLLTDATPLAGHTVHVRFEDGVDADLGLACLLEYGGALEPPAVLWGTARAARSCSADSPTGVKNKSAPNPGALGAKPVPHVPVTHTRHMPRQSTAKPGGHARLTIAALPGSGNLLDSERGY